MAGTPRPRARNSKPWPCERRPIRSNSCAILLPLARANSLDSHGRITTRGVSTQRWSGPEQPSDHRRSPSQRGTGGSSPATSPRPVPLFDVWRRPPLRIPARPALRANLEPRHAPTQRRSASPSPSAGLGRSTDLAIHATATSDKLSDYADAATPSQAETRPENRTPSTRRRISGPRSFEHRRRRRGVCLRRERFLHPAGQSHHRQGPMAPQGPLPVTRSLRLLEQRREGPRPGHVRQMGSAAPPSRTDPGRVPDFPRRGPQRSVRVRRQTDPRHPPTCPALQNELRRAGATG